MSVTAIDPQSALIVIDLQKGIAGYSLVHPIGEIVKKANALSDAFRRQGLPVVLVVAEGVAPGRTDQKRSHKQRPADAADLIAELHHEPTDHRVIKRTLGAFTNTGLEDYLRQRSVTQVVVAGVATAFGVESTVRHANELGFNVTVVTDAITDPSAENHAHSVESIFPRISESGTAQEVIDMLATTRAQEILP